MSSPAVLRSLPSSPSSSSEHQSTASSTPPSVPSKRKKISHLGKNNHDRYLISAEHWTPIIGPSLPKRQKNLSSVPPNPSPFDPLKQQQNSHGTSDPTLVRLFDPHPSSSSSSSSSSPSTHQPDQPILVTVQQKVSLYVTCFEDMLNTVLEHEHFLFSPSELVLLSSWNGLSYPSKYLFVRLFMRKHDNWFRLDKLLNYSVDIGGVQPACEALCKPVDQLIRAIPPKTTTPTDQKQTPSILPLELPPSHDDVLISELVEFLTDPPRPASTCAPVHPEFTLTDVDPDQLEEWCLLAGKLSHSLDQALDALGIQDWSTPAPPYDVDDSHVLPNIPPIPPAVHINPPVIITQPKFPSTICPTSPPAFAFAEQSDDDFELDVPICTIRKPVQPSPTPSRSTSSPPAFDEIDPELSSFASMTSDDYGVLKTDELFSCLNMDELKGLAKKLNANPHTTRDMIILGIKAATRNQSTLFGAAPPKGKQKRQLSLKFTQKGLKESQVLSLNSTRPCIKLTPKVCSLFKRLHLIFYRSTTVSEKTMTASMLARMNLRSYPKYQVIRTNSIFDSRQSLINYEDALELEKKLDDLLLDERRPWNEDQQAKARRQEAKTLRLKKGLDLFETAWLLWQQTVIEEDARLESLQSTPQFNETDLDRSTYYKRRFHPGWPLTRIMQKGLGILGRFKEYEREVHVLEALLQQRHFRRGKRGQWYDRLALVLMTKLSPNKGSEPSPTHSHDHQQSALYTCEQGLLDPDTHQIYRFSLSRRLIKLQSILTRQDQQSNTTASKSKDKRQSERNYTNQDEINNSIAELSSMEEWRCLPKVTIHRVKLSDDHQTGQKTSWKSLEDNNSALTVEEVSLEHYSSHGWRGFHSEGSIVKMIVST